VSIKRRDLEENGFHLLREGENHSDPIYYLLLTLLYISKDVNVMKYKVILQQPEEGFAVSVPGLPGCHSQGATEQEALDNIGNAMQNILK